jgi:hypothetical protein
VRRLRASHSYGLVLVLILSAFLFAVLVPDGRWATSVLVLVLCATLVCALWTSGIAEVGSRRNVALVAVAGVATLGNLIVAGRLTAGLTSLFAGLLTVAIAVVVGRGVVDQGEINRQSVRGAIGIYVLVGLLFAFFYGAIAALDSSPFFAQGTDGTRPLRVYFSYITMTTVGYGDYTAAGTLGHALAVMEALIGQVYLVTVVALIVSRLGQRRDRSQEDASSLIPPG